MTGISWSDWIPDIKNCHTIQREKLRFQSLRNQFREQRPASALRRPQQESVPCSENINLGWIFKPDRREEAKDTPKRKNGVKKHLNDQNVFRGDFEVSLKFIPDDSSYSGNDNDKNNED
ncbi:hypothetical protein HDU97_005716 [Phlyctochytrium planicorne]|nr:hypothetical protein HDU97_005716 [Phlyctochytrium planicorne]